MKKVRANKMKVLDCLVKKDLINYDTVRIEDFVSGEILALRTMYDDMYFEQLNYDVSQRLACGIREEIDYSLYDGRILSFTLVIYAK